MSLPPLRYLSAADVDRCLPDVEQRLDLAARALLALARGDAEMPSKIGVHPRAGSFLHAMPAWLRDGDLAGLKWIAAYPDNRSAGLPAINGLVVLNDPATGLPTWIMDAARITALRTAAVSGVAIRLMRPRGFERAAILGAGIQARSHLEVLHSLAPSAAVVIYDRNPDRAEALAAEAAGSGINACAAADAREAVGSAEVVVTVAGMGGTRQVMTPDWPAPGTLIVAVDFATYVSAELARSARSFVVDDRDQFLAYRDAGYFDGYPDPGGTIGGEIDAAATGTTGAQPAAIDVVTHLGVGLADVIFADAIAGNADAEGVGTELAR